MNKKVYLKTFILIIISLLFLFSTVSYSNGNYSITMTLSGSSQVKEGESITLVASLSNVNAGEGVEAFSARLNYDSNLYEYVSVSGNNYWKTSFDTSSNTIIGFKGSKVTSSESVFTVTLKTRDGICVDNSSVTVQNIQFSGGAISNGGTGDIRVASAGTSFTIIKNQPIINEEVEEIEQIEVLDEGQVIERQVGQTTRNLDYNYQEENEIKQLEETEKTDEELKQDEVIEEIKIAKESFPQSLISNKKTEQLDATESIQVSDYRISKTARTIITVVGVVIVLVLGYKLFQKTKMIIF